MAELTPQERLQPSLLDRLTDDRPERRVESRDERVLSLERLREAVMRDLTWLLNTGNLAQVQDIEAYPAVAESVVNYGIPDLAGTMVTGTSANDFANQIREAILRFEPRLIPDTVIVQATLGDGGSEHNHLNFEIQGDLWAEPMPLRLFLRTQVDLESGSVTITEEDFE